MKSQMSTIVAVLSFIVVLSTVGRADESTGVKADNQIAELNKLIIPPKGTGKPDVDAIYGDPKETKEPKPGGKGSATDYPMHTYEFFPRADGEGFRAFLYVTYRNGRVWLAGINHSVVMKNRMGYECGVPEDLKQKEEIKQENQQVLIDLQDIRDRFAEKLRSAPWNKTKTHEIPEKPDVEFRLEGGIEYTLAGSWLYHPEHEGSPGPAEKDTGIAWSFANEFVYRTALSKNFVVPAAEVGPTETSWYHVGFISKDGNVRGGSLIQGHCPARASRLTGVGNRNATKRLELPVALRGCGFRYVTPQPAGTRNSAGMPLRTTSSLVSPAFLSAAVSFSSPASNRPRILGRQAPIHQVCRGEYPFPSGSAWQTTRRSGSSCCSFSMSSLTVIMSNDVVR